MPQFTAPCAAFRSSDISQVTPNLEQIVGRCRQQWKKFLSAAIPQSHFDDLAALQPLSVLASQKSLDFIESDWPTMHKLLWQINRDEPF